jgi:hypothetical protein
LNKLLIRSAILCRLPLGNGQKGGKKKRPCESVFQDNGLLSDETNMPLEIILMVAAQK